MPLVRTPMITTAVSLHACADADEAAMMVAKPSCISQTVSPAYGQIRLSDLFIGTND